MHDSNAVATLTEKEAAMLVAFIQEGAECNGADCAEHLLEDNMTWQDPGFLKDVLGWSFEQIGGVMSSLEAKGLIVNSGEPLPERSVNAWTASDEGIRVGWPLYRPEEPTALPPAPVMTSDELREDTKAAVESGAVNKDGRVAVNPQAALYAEAAGHDPYQKFADDHGCTRDEAKGALLGEMYGGGTRAFEDAMKGGGHTPDLSAFQEVDFAAFDARVNEWLAKPSPDDKYGTRRQRQGGKRANRKPRCLYAQLDRMVTKKGLSDLVSTVAAIVSDRAADANDRGDIPARAEPTKLSSELRLAVAGLVNTEQGR